MTGQPALSNSHSHSGRDYVFLAALLALAAVPLLFLRRNPLLYAPGLVPAIWLVGAGLFAVWVFFDRQRTDSQSHEAIGWNGVIRAVGFVLAFVAVAVVVYYLPMREHFWGGYDERLQPERRAVWSSGWDELHSRPTWGIAPLVGSLLTPNRIEGHLWQAVGLCIVNGLLVTMIVWRLLPGEPAIAAAAGVLLLCHRGDISRFYVLWTTNWYMTSLAFLLLGIWLFLESARTRNRGGLVAACVALGTSLLGSEAGYPLAALGPVLLWLSGIRGSALRVWSVAWLGTISLLAVRFILYFLSEQTYQAGQMIGMSSRGDQLLQHLLCQIEPFQTWFTGFRILGTYARSATAAALMSAIAVLLGGWASGGGSRRYVLGVTVAVACTAAGLVAFLPMVNTFRTQFYTAPGQAALIAVALGGACRLLGRRAGPVLLAAGVAVLAGAAAAENRKFQRDADKFVNFAKIVRVLRQLEAAPAIRQPNTLVVLFEENGSGMLGSNVNLQDLSTIIGYDLIQANCTDAFGISAKFEPTEVVIAVHGNEKFISKRAVSRYSYDRVVAYRVAPDGSVFLLRQLPAELQLGAAATQGYDPLKLLNSDPARELPYFRYPRWVKRPGDVIPAEQGFLLGEGWSHLLESEGRLFRTLAPGAELIVNPLGQSSRTIPLEVEPVNMSAGGNCTLEARTLAGQVLSRTAFRGHERVNLTIPTDPAQVSVITLWAGPAEQLLSASTVIPLHVFAPPGARALPATPGKKCDIFGVGLRMGRNWYPLENYSGESYRWMATGGAEIVLGERRDATNLVIDLAGGPALGGKPGLLRAIGPERRVLHEEAYLERKKISIPIPPELSPGSVVKLEVVGDVLPVSDYDPRILSALVYRCEWMTTVDITGKGLRLGRNWQPIENHTGEKYRWLATGGAEIVLGDRADATDLLVELAPGPALGGKPGLLRVIGPDGRILREESYFERKKVRIPIPQELSKDRVVKLEVVGAGLPVSNSDPRILSALVYHIDWVAPLRAPSDGVERGVSARP